VKAEDIGETTRVKIYAGLAAVAALAEAGVLDRVVRPERSDVDARRASWRFRSRIARSPTRLPRVYSHEGCCGSMAMALGGSDAEERSIESPRSLEKRIQRAYVLPIASGLRM